MIGVLNYGCCRLYNLYSLDSMNIRTKYDVLKGSLSVRNDWFVVQVRNISRKMGVREWILLIELRMFLLPMPETMMFKWQDVEMHNLGA